MANESDNLVLIQLGEIRATLADHSARFDQMDKRFDHLDRRFEDFHALTNHTLMLSTATDLRMRDLDRRYEFGEGEQRRITDRMDDFERRLSEVERKLDE
jgi:tetrahydromethanopterin S-methyltransferase subunit G